MQIITCDSPWWFSKLIVPPGSYVVDDVAAAQCLTQTRGTILETLQPEHIPFMPKPGEDIIVHRPGSFGDLLLLTPVIRKLKSVYPDNKVVVACHPRYAPILSGVVDVTDYPLDLKTWKEHVGHHIWMEGVVEAPDETGIRYTSRFARRAGFDKKQFGRGDDRLTYILTPEEQAWQKDTYPRVEGKARIGIQVKASCLNRTYNWYKILEVMAKLIGNHLFPCEIYLFGGPGDVRLPEPVDDVVNLADEEISMPVRMSIAVAKSCDAMLVPDSLMMHVGSALDIPTLVLSGAFDPADTLSSVSPTVEVMRGMGSCRNCRWLPVAGTQFPPGNRCADENHCIVIDGISPDLIASKLRKMVEGGKK